MHMYDCPKFDGCNAPICPLDPNWKRARHMDGERACFYLTEYAKPNARPILERALTEDLCQTLVNVYPEIIVQPGWLKRQLSRSSVNPPRIGRMPGRAAA